MQINEARILITGASSGIGAALACQFAAQGARLILSARRETGLRKVAMEIARRHPQTARPRTVVCDLTDHHATDHLIQEAVASWGGLDALVNNAGISAYGEGNRISTDDYRRVMEVNYFAPVRTTLAVLPHFLERGEGMLVNVASLAALHGVPFLGAYGASKAAIVNFSQSLRAEIRRARVRVMVVYPNYTDTELFQKETRAGSARRPSFRYEPAGDVARAIVRGMEKDREEMVLTFSGKAMQRVRGLLPSVLDHVMARMATRLGGKNSYCTRGEAS